MEKGEEPHRMRLSIDIKSLKDNDFIGQVYVKFSPVAELGITKPFRTSPLLQLSTAKVQQIFPNGFSSYYFNATGSTLSTTLDKVIDVELWHSDRMKKDLLIGVVKLEVKNLAESSVRKTKQSYARVFDAYLPVDELNESGEIVRKVGTMRMLLYLEDLGPVSGLREKEQELGLREPLIYEIKDVDPPMLPSQNPELSGQDKLRQIQLNELEYKVVWELETWRKAEEAKTKIHLKQKQVEFLAQLAEEQRKQDIQKQKQFKKIEGNLLLLEKKLRDKSGELQKRQQKIVLMQEENKSKVTQMSRLLHLKDEELESLRRKAKDDKANWAKQKGSLEAQIHSLKGENTRLKIDLEEASKQDEKSPIAIIRNQLNNRLADIKTLQKENQNLHEVKKLYEQSYGKMREEVKYLKKEVQKKNSTMESLKTENEVLKANLKLLQEQLNVANQRVQFQPHAMPQPHLNYNYNDGNGKPEPEPVFSNEIQRYKYERQQYLNSGVYTPSDPFIKQYDKLIGNY